MIVWWIIQVLSPCTSRLIHPESLAGQSLIGQTAVHNVSVLGRQALEPSLVIPAPDEPKRRPSWPNGYEFRGASRQGHRKRQIRRQWMPQTKDLEQIPRIWVWLRLPSCTHRSWALMTLRRGRCSKARLKQSFVRHSHRRRFSHKRPFS